MQKPRLDDTPIFLVQSQTITKRRRGAHSSEIPSCYYKYIKMQDLLKNIPLKILSSVFQGIVQQWI